MIKVEHLKVMNIDGAIWGMRNPMNSHDKSDSGFDPETGDYIIGDNDLDLMKRLYKGGPEHRKYLRQIFVSMDITAPLYWWKEFDTYKVGTVANSESTMHTIHKRELALDDFSHEHLCNNSIAALENCIRQINSCRSIFVMTKDKDFWWQIIQLLPTSFNQRRTVTMNYENIVTIVKQRSGHKLDEWNEFCDILRSLPLVTDIMEDNG